MNTILWYDISDSRIQFSWWTVLDIVGYSAGGGLSYGRGQERAGRGWRRGKGLGESTEFRTREPRIDPDGDAEARHPRQGERGHVGSKSARGCGRRSGSDTAYLASSTTPATTPYLSFKLVLSGWFYQKMHWWFPNLAGAEWHPAVCQGLVWLHNSIRWTLQWRLMYFTPSIIMLATRTLFCLGRHRVGIFSVQCWRSSG